MAYAIAEQALQAAVIQPPYDMRFLADVIKGLSSTPKSISPKYFYDENGSRFFDEICQLKEYYLYKTELALLPRVASDLAGMLTGSFSVVEFGAGSLQKIRPFLRNIPAIKSFYPIDISGAYLRDTTRKLQAEFPDVAMQAVEGDFTLPVHLPEPSATREQRLGFFPGSTIGNFTPEQAKRFLLNARKTLGDDAYLIIGVDTKKSPDILHRAYNDDKGVTKRFNLNVLSRINREFDCDLKLSDFEHYAFYNPVEGRIEMHLVSQTHQTVNIVGTDITFRSGETIHTESSYKYTPQEFMQLAQSAGWRIERTWLAGEAMFSTYLLRVDH
ncbi:MAG TPA: L-histidine N(alpha)-methyltransferase [Marinagarivorans sp.]